MTDPIADMLTRIRNAIAAKHSRVDIPASKLKLEIARILKEEGYINNFVIKGEGLKRTVRIFLRYDARGTSSITHLQRISTPRVRRLERHSEGARRLWHQHRVDLERFDERQGGASRKHRRRAVGPDLLIGTNVMSRIGRKVIAVPKGVTVTIHEQELEVKGPKGTLKTPIPQGISFKVEGEELKAERASDEQAALHGLARALANNAIVGVTEGFSKQMDVVGVGYKADVQGKKIVFSLGYSHPIEFPLPAEVDAKAERLTTKGSIQQYQTTLTLTSIDKQKLGQVAAEMHKLRKPDAYKGKGVRYANVPIKLKPGKTGK
jgi:large subunit ribosomal protein L6